MGNKIQTKPPVVMPSIDGGECPDCGHAELGKKDWISRLFRMGARCPHWEASDDTEVGLPGECSCTHAYHG
jgi:hypothetical protein